MPLFRRARRDAATPRHASLYRVGDTLVLGSLDRVGGGFWVATDRVTSLPADSPLETVGTAVLDTLAGSRLDAPAPMQDISADDPAAVAAAGYRSYRDFVQHAVLVVLGRAGDTLTFTPTRNGGLTGPERGFQHEPAKTLTCPAIPAVAG